MTARQSLVRRTALFERLSAADAGAVVLVCAPAGSGKSVLVRSWAEASGLRNRLAWVAVERGQRDGQRFLLATLDALAEIDGSLRRVTSAPAVRGELIVQRLLCELGGLEAPLLLVVDDLHELRSAEALGWLELLVARLPTTLRLVLITREDPELGLHRLRLTGRLTELRAPDLRFSLEETRELLEAAGIVLSDAGVALLHERTEGWATGLRLAVISLSQNPEPEQFVREFSGSERTVAGYLLAEVLEHQPAEVREMLLRTSVLERVSGSLADFLTGGSGAERILHALEDANAFVSSLDVGRSWFRYHHLFADLLQLELRRVSPAMIAPLHRAAAQWHEQEGNVIEAIQHAQAARDWPLASRLLAEHHGDLTLEGRTATVCRLLSRFPDDVVAADAELALVFAAARLLNGALEQGAAYTELAERLADTVPDERRQSFDLQLFEQRLVLARWRCDVEGVQETIPLLQAALAAQPIHGRVLTEENRAVALQNLGIAELWSSQFHQARRDLEQALSLERRSERPWLQVTCLGHLALAGLFTGLPLSAGLELSEEAVRIADAHGWGEHPVVVAGLGTGAIALLLMGRLDEAELWLDRAERTLITGAEPATELVVRQARGVLRLAQGRFEDAMVALRAAEGIEAQLVSRHASSTAVRARVLQTQARMGELGAARAGLAEMPPEDRDTAHARIAAAAIHLAEGDPEHAIGVLAPVIEGDAPAIHRLATTTEAHVLGAAAREQLGDERAAETSLERALELAEPEGLVLPFLYLPVPAILERVRRHRTAHAALVRTILGVVAGFSPSPSDDVAPLLEELSDAELRVVRYLPSNLKAPEIAAELCVSANTVRTHIRHVYAKLDAHDRNEAVVRARGLGLLRRSP